MAPSDFPLWQFWMAAVSDEKSPQPLGFQCGFAHLARARARYRVAVSYRGLSLDGFASSTVNAYSALVGLVLAYGAFEQYAVGLGHKKQAARSKWFGAFLPLDYDETIRSHDPDGHIFNLISSKVERSVLDAVQRYRDRKDYCPSVLAAAVRHVFVHGILAASSNRAEPSDVASLSGYLSELLLAGIAADFQLRVRGWDNHV